jgi:hypothetical protein
VVPVAADIATGKLVVLEPGVATVDALCAACASTPWFAPQKLPVTPEKKGDDTEAWLVDAVGVSREPIQPVLDLVKRLNIHLASLPGEPPRPFDDLKLSAEPTLVELCVISPYPTARVRDQERFQMIKDMTQEELQTDIQKTRLANKPRIPGWSAPGTLFRLADIFALQATHAAKDERAMVAMYNAALRPHQNIGKASFCTASDEGERKKIENWHVFATLREIEPSTAIQLPGRLARCTDENKKRSLLLATIADGCRESLMGLFGNLLHNLASDPQILAELQLARAEIKLGTQPRTPVTPPCRKLQSQFMIDRKITPLPGIVEPKSPPGVTEICKECRFYNATIESWDEAAKRKGTIPNEQEPRVQDWGEVTSAPVDRVNVKDLRQKLEQQDPDQWPRDRVEVGELSPTKGKERPVVSLVFSGGVFRGVFQVGVLNGRRCWGFSRHDSGGVVGPGVHGTRPNPTASARRNRGFNFSRHRSVGPHGSAR